MLFCGRPLTVIANPMEADSEMAHHMTRAIDDDNDDDSTKGILGDGEFEGDAGKAATNFEPCVRASRELLLQSSFCVRITRELLLHAWDAY